MHDRNPCSRVTNTFIVVTLYYRDCKIPLPHPNLFLPWLDTSTKISKMQDICMCKCMWYVCLQDLTTITHPCFSSHNARWKLESHVPRFGSAERSGGVTMHCSNLHKPPQILCLIWRPKNGIAILLFSRKVLPCHAIRSPSLNHINPSPWLFSK